MNIVADTKWYPEQQLLVTQLSGKIELKHVEAWKSSLVSALSLVPDNSSFKILIDLFGFEAVDTETHKAYRTIVPTLLAAYNYRIGYLDMFPEAEVVLKKERGIVCVAMANIHHNQSKMTDYQNRFSSAHEQYFSDIESGLNWINSIAV